MAGTDPSSPDSELRASPRADATSERPARPLSRRGFAQASLLVPATLAACGDDTESGPGTRVATLAELESHEPVEFTLPDGEEAFAVKLRTAAEGGVGPDRSIVAFSTVCPHMGCPIDVTTGVDPDRGRFGPCICHQSVFDLGKNGRMVHGRASTNLSRIELTIRDGVVWATKPTGLAFGQPLTSAHALTIAPSDALDEPR